MYPHYYYIIILLFLAIVIIFIYDFKSIEIKIISDQYPEIINLENQLQECEKNEQKHCSFIKDKIKIIKENKPSIISVFFVWIIDAINNIFKLLSLYNLILLIILIISIKFIILN